MIIETLQITPDMNTRTTRVTRARAIRAAAVLLMAPLWACGSATPSGQADTSLDTAAPTASSSAMAQPPATPRCFVGGCNGEICSDKAAQPGICDRPRGVDCYHGEKCEAQGDGTCGWSMSAALKKCLADAKK